MKNKKEFEEFKKALNEALKIEKEGFREIELMAEKIKECRRERYSFKEASTSYEIDNKKEETKRNLSYTECSA